MIAEDQLEQVTLQWFQDTGWNYANGADLAPKPAAFRSEVLKARRATVARRLDPLSQKEMQAMVKGCSHIRPARRTR